MNHLLAPWRLITLGIGIGILYVGMHVHPAPDWTHGTIWAMALPTYVLAPWVIGVIERFQWRRFPLAVLATWFCVDGVWWLALKLEGNQFAIDTMREGNWPASLCLFLICGMVWRNRRAQ